MIDVNILSAARAAVREGYGLPTSWFSDPAIYEFELERVFDDAWTSIGPLSRLKQAGNCMTGQIGRTPVVVVRDGDGALRGFVNVCRHRGYPVVEQDSEKAVLVCRYHAWSYHLDGTLRNARRCPVSAGDPDLGLIPVSVHVARGLVFVNPNQDAEPFDERHPAFETVAEQQQYDVTDWEYLSQSVFEIPANWKAFNENVHECYHCPSIHPTSFGTAFDVDAADWTTTSEHVWYHTFPHKDKDGAEKFDRGVFLFPSVMLFDNGLVAGTGYTSPTGPETSRFTLDFLIAPGADRQQAEHMRGVYVQTLDEDIEVIRKQHVGIRSGKVAHFLMFEENEPMVRFFHRCLLELYERGLEQPAAVS